MKFKKGDLVEVIKEDEYCGYIFPKGSRWTVYNDQRDDNIIRVCDDRHELKYSILWSDCVKKVDCEFKKGDIVKVIKEDCFGGSVYPVGSVWEVDSVLPGNNLLMIKDSREAFGTAALFRYRVKKVESCEPRFKLGDMVKVKSSIYCNDNSIGKIYKVENIKTNLVGDRGIVYLATGVNGDYTKTWPYRYYEVELVDVNKCDQMELYELIQQCESLRNSNKKLEEDLVKEKKRSNKFFEHATKRFEIIQEQNEENKDLKSQIKFLEGELRHKATCLKALKNEKLTYAQRVSELIEENGMLKEDLERKKFFKNLLTKNKD